MPWIHAARLATALAAIHGTARVAGNGPPLAGVAITVDGTWRTRTDSLGGYRLDSLTPGRHDVRFSRVGYDARRVTILLAEGSDLAIDIELTPTDHPPADRGDRHPGPSASRSAQARAMAGPPTAATISTPTGSSATPPRRSTSTRSWPPSPGSPRAVTTR